MTESVFLGGVHYFPPIHSSIIVSKVRNEKIIAPTKSFNIIAP